MPVIPLGNPRVSVQTSDGWEELAGVTRIAIDVQHQPIDGWPNHGYGTGKTMGMFAFLDQAWVAPPIDLAMAILRPHLARCPLYVS